MKMTPAQADFRIALDSTSTVMPLSWILSLMTTSLIIVAVMIGWAGLSIDFLKPSNAVYLLALILLGCIRFTLRERRGKRTKIAMDFCEYIGLFVFISLLGATASYPAAVATSGFVDAELAYLDMLLGFDWPSWYQLVSGNQALQTLGSLAYANIYLSPVLILGGLAITGERARAQLFLLSFWFAAVVTLIMFLAIPAVGPLAYLWKGPITYMPTSALYQAELLPLLQERGMGQVDLGALQGLVCAPSFHTAAAVIFIVIAWQCKYLRWPLILLNGAMLLSTPVEGTHYLIDMICGAFVGLFAIGTIGAIQNAIPKWRQMFNLREVKILQHLTLSSAAVDQQAVRRLRD